MTSHPDEEIVLSPEYQRLLGQYQKEKLDREYLARQVLDLGRYITRLHTSVDLLEQERRKLLGT